MVDLLKEYALPMAMDIVGSDDPADKRVQAQMLAIRYGWCFSPSPYSRAQERKRVVEMVMRWVEHGNIPNVMNRWTLVDGVPQMPTIPNDLAAEVDL